MIDNLKQAQEQWFNENAPFGKELGYPECCINAFCDQPPALLTHPLYRPTNDDRLRYKAGCINGVFTGFIPCIEHAKEIVAGRITLESLIKNRSEKFGAFPHHIPPIFMK